MTASLDTVFASINNAVQAINNLGQAYAYVNGTKTSQSIPAASSNVMITSGQGRLVAVSVTTAGSTAGEIYDSNKATPVPNTLLAAVPNTVGVHAIGSPFINGLVISTGTGQVATLIYS